MMDLIRVWHGRGVQVEFYCRNIKFLVAKPKFENTEPPTHLNPKYSLKFCLNSEYSLTDIFSKSTVNTP